MEKSKDGVKMESECDLSSELHCKKENLDISQPSCESEDCAVVDLNGDGSTLMLKSEKDNIGFSVKMESNEECCESKDYFKTELGHDCADADVQVLNIKHEEVHIKTEEVDYSRHQHDARIRSKFGMYKSNSRHDIDKHKLEHLNSSKLIYSCKICNYATKDKHDLETHMQTHLDLEAQEYDCKFCDFKATGKSALRDHLLVHQCNICGVMKKEQDLKSHMELHKNMPQTNMFQCKMCGFKAIGMMGLIVHRSRKHRYPIRENSTKIKGHLKNHKIVHEEKP